MHHAQWRRMIGGEGGEEKTGVEESSNEHKTESEKVRF